MVTCLYSVHTYLLSLSMLIFFQMVGMPRYIIIASTLPDFLQEERIFQERNIMTDAMGE